MARYNRVFLVIIDSLGIGAMPDSADYGDIGVNTLNSVSKAKKLHIPNLVKLGLANLCKVEGVDPVEQPMGVCARLAERSVSKDTLTGHWELMGVLVDKPFKTFTDTGFPADLIAELEKRTGHKVIGNRSASGTEIIDELGEQEIATGNMIVYTSADSVMQICGNEETFDLKELYRCCEIARELTLDERWLLGRVIARPYVGKKPGEFVRTANRHDYALKPINRTALDALKEGGKTVISIGKIYDIFDGEGITEFEKSKSSVHGMEQTIAAAKTKDFSGLCFTNLVDFDALWGHRRNPLGYAQELERFDVLLGELMESMREDDLLMIAADHGTDPMYSGTDHTREYVPLIMYSKYNKVGNILPDMDTFGVVGATIADIFSVPMPQGTIGNSIKEYI